MIIIVFIVEIKNMDFIINVKLVINLNGIWNEYKDNFCLNWDYNESNEYN